MEKVIDDAEATIESTINSKSTDSKGSLLVPIYITLPRRDSSPYFVRWSNKAAVHGCPSRSNSEAKSAKLHSDALDWLQPIEDANADYKDKPSVMGFVTTSSTTGGKRMRSNPPEAFSFSQAGVQVMKPPSLCGPR